MKPSSISLRLYRKSTQQLEPFNLTSSALYVGSTECTAYPITLSTKCVYASSALTFSTEKLQEEFDVEDPELACQIQQQVLRSQEQLKTLLAGTTKLLEQGVYFVVCIFVDAWDTGRSKRSSLGPWSTFNGKEKKVLWVDSELANIFISNAKGNVRKACKIPVNSVLRIVLEPCGECASYRMVILTKSLAEHFVSLYSSDFFKIRECMMGLENLCANSKDSSYVGKPHSHIGLLFQKSLYTLKTAKEDGHHRTFKDLFSKFVVPFEENLPEELASEDVVDDETALPGITNDFNDTKKLSNQLISSINPQELVKEGKIRLRRQLSIYSHPEETQEEGPLKEDLRSTSGLFRAKLSPIKLPQTGHSSVESSFQMGKVPPVTVSMAHQKSISTDCTGQRGEIKVLDSCCSDSVDCMVTGPEVSTTSTRQKVDDSSSYVKVVDDTSQGFIDNSFSADKGVSLGQENETDVPFETARFQKQGPSGGCSQTEREFEHSLRSGQLGIERQVVKEESKSAEDEELMEKYRIIKQKSKGTKELMQKQNVQLGSLLAKCEMQEEKIKKLKQSKETRESELQRQIQSLQAQLASARAERDEWRTRSEGLKGSNEELKQTNADLKKKLQRIVGLIEPSSRYFRTERENPGPRQHIEITQNVIEFRSPKAQVPRVSQKSQSQTKKTQSPHKHVADTFKDIINTLLK